MRSGDVPGGRPVPVTSATVPSVPDPSAAVRAGQGEPVPPPVIDDEARRNRQVTRGLAAGLVTRVVAAATPLVLVPITLHLLGRQIYGLWMTAAAIAGALTFADLGLGNGLLTRLSVLVAEGDRARARVLTSSVYAMVATGAALLCLLAVGGGTLHLWSRVFGVEQVVDGVSTDFVISACLVAFLAFIPLLLVQRVQYACQQSAQANLWQAVATAAVIPVVLLVRESRQEVILLAVLGTTPLLYLLYSVAYFRWVRPDLAPSPRLVDLAVARDMVRLGLVFMVLTTIIAVATAVDTYAITTMVGLAAVAAYVIPMRLFAQVGQLVTMLNLPLWPAHAEALARGNHAWVRRVTRRMSLVSAGAAGAVGLVLGAWGPWLLDLWTRQSLGTSRTVIVGMALWWALQAAFSPFFMVQNSQAVLRPQLVGWTAFLVVSLPAKFAVAALHQVDLIPWVAAGAYLATVVPACVVGYRRALAEVPPARVARQPR